jgi:hypothetical protein
VLAWGLTWPVNKVVLATLPPIWAVSLRAAIATIALFALQAASGRLTLPPRGDLPVLISITLLHMVGFNLLASWGWGGPHGRNLCVHHAALVRRPRPFCWTVAHATARDQRDRQPHRSRRALQPLVFDWSDREVVLGTSPSWPGPVGQPASLSGRTAGSPLLSC